MVFFRLEYLIQVYFPLIFYIRLRITNHDTLMVCKLIDGWYSIVIQCVLGCLSFSSLWLKRYLETEPKRDYLVFLFDVSKQGIGLFVAHGINISIARLLSNQNKHQDQCIWYFINFCVDVLAGMPLNYLGIYLLRKHSHRCRDPSWQSGHYEELENNYQQFEHKTNCEKTIQIFKIKSYWKQLTAWIIIILIVKLIMLGCILKPLSSPLFQAGESILSPVTDNEDVELVIVMIIIPICLNMIQYWIQDNFLMFKGIPTSVFVNRPVAELCPIENTDYADL